MASVNLQLSDNLKKIKSIYSSLNNIKINKNDLTIDDKTLTTLENIKDTLSLIGIQTELLIGQAYENKSNSFNNIISLIDYQLTSGSEGETDDEYDCFHQQNSVQSIPSIPSTSIDININNYDNYTSICEFMESDNKLLDTITGDNNSIGTTSTTSTTSTITSVENADSNTNVNTNTNANANTFKTNIKKLSPKLFTMLLYTYMLQDPKSILNDPNALQGRKSSTLEMAVNGYDYFNDRYCDDNAKSENVKTSNVDELD